MTFHLADSLDNAGFQFPAVGAAQEKLFTFQANRDTIAGLPFAGQVSVSRPKIVLSCVNHSFNVDYDGWVGEVACGFSQNFRFGFAPVVDVVT